MGEACTAIPWPTTITALDSKQKGSYSAYCDSIARSLKVTQCRAWTAFSKLELSEKSVVFGTGYKRVTFGGKNHTPEEEEEDEEEETTLNKTAPRTEKKKKKKKSSHKCNNDQQKRDFFFILLLKKKNPQIQPTVSLLHFDTGSFFTGRFTYWSCSGPVLCCRDAARPAGIKTRGAADHLAPISWIAAGEELGLEQSVSF